MTLYYFVYALETDKIHFTKTRYLYFSQQREHLRVSLDLVDVLSHIHHRLLGALQPAELFMILHHKQKLPTVIP